MIELIIGIIVGTLLGFLLASLCRMSYVSDLEIRNAFLEQENLKLKSEVKND